MAQIDHAGEPLGRSWRRKLKAMASAEFEPPTEVRRPWLVSVLGAFAFVAALGAVTGLGGLSAALQERPVTLAAESDLLEAALQEAPWDELGGDGPVVWAVAPVRCGECAPFFEKDLPALAAQGLRVRLIVIEPRSANPPRKEEAARAAPEFIRVRALDPTPSLFAAAEPEGRLEWARASYDRIAAIMAVNGAPMELPCLIWRRGSEWRAAFARAGRGAEHARQELTPDA
jgi:hypothetical protein